MNKKQLKGISYIYLILPICIFLLGYIKLIFSVVPVALLFIILLRKCLEKDEKEKFIKKRYIFLIYFIVFLVCIYAGLGGMFYQSKDWHCRNAIFRDLINFDWPVYYQESSYALTYYIGIWIVPAVIRKSIFMALWRSNSMDCSGILHY